MQPERVLGGEYSIRSEVWSVGISVLEMALGRFPYCKVQSKLLSVLLETEFIAFLTALLSTSGLRPFQLYFGAGCTKSRSTE